MKLYEKVAKERNVGFDALNVSHFWSGDYILVCGSNKKCMLYTREGIFIGSVAEQSSWIWSSKSSPDGNKIVKHLHKKVLCSKLASISLLGSWMSGWHRCNL